MDTTVEVPFVNKVVLIIWDVIDMEIVEDSGVCDSTVP